MAYLVVGPVRGMDVLLLPRVPQTLHLHQQPDILAQQMAHRLHQQDRTRVVGDQIPELLRVRE